MLQTVPPERRGDAAAVAAAIVEFAGFELIEGRWADADDPDAYAGGLAPGRWRGTHEVCSVYLDRGSSEPVRYGQCFVFGMTTTGLLRSLGIPARTVTVLGSGHDQEPEWGLLTTWVVCLEWDGTRCAREGGRTKTTTVSSLDRCVVTRDPAIDCEFTPRALLET